MGTLSESFSRPAPRAAAIMIVVFLAGVLSGVALDRTVFRLPLRMLLAERPTPPEVPILVSRLEQLLELTPEQAVRVRGLLEARQPRIRAEWAAARAALLAQVDTTLTDLATILTPEQNAALRQRLEARGLPRAP